MLLNFLSIVCFQKNRTQLRYVHIPCWQERNDYAILTPSTLRYALCYPTPTSRLPSTWQSKVNISLRNFRTVLYVSLNRELSSSDHASEPRVSVKAHFTSVLQHRRWCTFTYLAIRKSTCTSTCTNSIKTKLYVYCYIIYTMSCE